ncbi:hypothetical protein ASG88_21110 [Nocardioides sp. Soil777]|nr:hypothetical protein ASG88_21110 [Nocardioides sp. Soil777]
MGRALLVTGVPRSGTTWVARLLATTGSTSLAGREPMNPRGRQFALAGTVHEWTRLTQESAHQRRILKRAYAGWDPRVYSRYGRRQWAAPLPGSRMIVKDPFALLSLPMLARVTGAVPLVVHRHPAAVLASYRRMGWSPDLEEVRVIVDAVRRSHPALPVSAVPTGPLGEAEAMAVFWRGLHELFLLDAGALTSLVVISHDRLVGNEVLCRALVDRLNLRWTGETDAELRHEESLSTSPRQGLHDFNRSPQEVAEGWRRRVTQAEVDEMEQLTVDVRGRLASMSLDCETAPGWGPAT